MAGLLYKNWRQMFGNLMVLLVTQILCSATEILFAFFASSAGEMSADDINILVVLPTVLTFFMFFFVLMTYQDGLFGFDEKHSWTFFTISAPTGYAGQIRSKYYFLFAEFVAVFFFAFITDVIVCGIVDDTAYSASMTYMFIFSLMLIWAAIEIPFIVRFGSASGLQIKGAVISVIVLIAVIYFLFGDISIFDEPDVIAAIQEKMTTATSLGIIAVICGSAIPLYYLSYRISVKLYKKGAESYEN
ncbi:MAG: ABC-2 transporter permease [Huintestinicola sp.]